MGFEETYNIVFNLEDLPGLLTRDQQISSEAQVKSAAPKV